MTDTTQVDSTAAREAAMSRVQTQDTVLANLAASASTETIEKPLGDPVDGKPNEEVKPGKKTAQERIVELTHKRKEAESKAEASEQRARDLEAQLQALKTSAQPMEATAKPARAQFASDDEYIEALTDWKAREAVAKREREQFEARQQAEQVDLDEKWTRRQDAMIKAIPDYADVLGASNVVIPNYIERALKESDQGPEIAYFLALNPEEARKLAAMNPVTAIKRIAALERDLAEPDTPAKEAEPPKKSKAPAPIIPVRSAGTSASAGQAESFAEYKRRRQAQKA